MQSVVAAAAASYEDGPHTQTRDFFVEAAGLRRWRASSRQFGSHTKASHSSKDVLSQLCELSLGFKFASKA